jgi:hypothetical protein
MFKLLIDAPVTRRASRVFEARRIKSVDRLADESHDGPAHVTDP